MPEHAQPLSPRHGPLTRLSRSAPGLLLCLAIAAVAISIGSSPWSASHGLSALTLAIVIGMVIGNTVYPAWGARAGAGVSVAKQQWLRAGVVLYGLHLSVADLAAVGWRGIATDLVVLSTTFALACLIGRRLGLDRDTAVLVGAGSSICGAAAVLATEPVLRARSSQVTVAVATVVVFGTTSIFLYPWLYHWNLGTHWLPADMHGFGIYAGSTIHEVAQVVAAAGAVSPDAADAAVITKMIRVMMLAPFLIGLSAWLARSSPSAGSEGGATKRRITIPWFAIGFIVVAGLNSLPGVPAELRSVGLKIDGWLLAAAMAALGLTTHVGAIRQAGWRPLALAAVLFAWLLVGGGVVNRIVAAWLG